MNNENDFNIKINYIDNNSLDSLDDDFQTSGKYLTFNANTNGIGMINPKVNIDKKNTKISSNNDEDVETENNVNNNENKPSNILEINIPISENNKFSSKSRNENLEDRYYSHNSVVDMSKYKVGSFDDNSSNNNKKFNNSENKKLKDDEILHLKVTEESVNSNGMKKSKKLSPISKHKNKKKKLLFLEEKNKYKSPKKSLFEDERKEEKKEEEKVYRKDKNGVPICKKNKKKVKISFERPFEIITPIESYKKYNILLGMPKDENFNEKLGECQCCSLF
jgi:hypothetical protein